MTTRGKFNKVMQSGLRFEIYNKPVQDDYLWDINIFWREMEDTNDVAQDCKETGFDDIDDCLDDIYDVDL